MTACSQEVCGWLADWPAGQPARGFEWWCGDEWCDCSEAQIETWQPDGIWRKNLTTLWHGPFHSDGEPGANTELNRMAQHLRRHHNAEYHRIQWPWM